VTTVPSANDERVIPRGFAVAVFLAVVGLIVIVLAVQLIPDAQRPTILPAPQTTTITVPAPSP
jgi:hypothetical protein